MPSNNHLLQTPIPRTVHCHSRLLPCNPPAKRNRRNHIYFCTLMLCRKIHRQKMHTFILLAVHSTLIRCRIGMGPILRLPFSFRCHFLRSMFPAVSHLRTSQFLPQTLSTPKRHTHYYRNDAIRAMRHMRSNIPNRPLHSRKHRIQPNLAVLRPITTTTGTKHPQIHTQKYSLTPSMSTTS